MYAEQAMIDQTTAVGTGPVRHAAYNKQRLFLVSLLALVTAGLAASLWADIATDLQRIFFDPVDRAHSAEMIGAILGIPFLGFAFTMAIGSPLLDAIGMAILLPLSGVCFIAGTLIILFAALAGSGSVYNILLAGAVITGIGWGLVETVINPLTRMVKIFKCAERSRFSMMYVEDEHNHMRAAFGLRYRIGQPATPAAE
jgi:MFS family permease